MPKRTQKKNISMLLVAPIIINTPIGCFISVLRSHGVVRINSLVGVQKLWDGAYDIIVNFL